TADPTTVSAQLTDFARVRSAGSVSGTIGLTSPDGTQLGNLVVAAVSGNTLPSGAIVTSGALSYTVHDVPVGGTIDVQIALPNGSAPTGVFKLQSGQYVDVSSSAVISGNTITLHLTDGGLGDADGSANGVIVDPVIPVRRVAPAALSGVAASPGN